MYTEPGDCNSLIRRVSSGQNDMGKGGALGERAPCLLPANWEDADNVKEWFLQMMNRLPSPMKEGLRSLIVLTIWEVWRERNSRVFMKECRQVQKIMESIYDEANMWAHAGNKGLQLILPGRETSSLM